MFILTIISSLFVNMKKKSENGSKYYRFLLESCIKIAMVAARVHIHVTGAEMIPEDRRYLLVGNHISNFDPILAVHLFRKNKLIFVSKPENFKQPVFGPVVHACGFLSIDRDSPRNALKTIIEASNIIKEDRFSVGIYPEGTRNFGREPLLPFHNGSLKIAQMAHAPIVVVASRNTREIAKHFPWRGSNVYVDVLGVIEPEEIEGLKTDAIGERIREMLTAKLSEPID